MIGGCKKAEMDSERDEVATPIGCVRSSASSVAHVHNLRRSGWGEAGGAAGRVGTKRDRGRRVARSVGHLHITKFLDIPLCARMWRFVVSVVAYLRRRLNDRGANCGVPLLALDFSVNRRFPLTDLVVNVVGLGGAQKLKRTF